MSRPAAVLLDAGGVLLFPNPWAISSVLRAAGGTLAPDEVSRAHYACIAAMDSSEVPDWPAYNKKLIELADVSAARADDALAAVSQLYLAPAPSLWNVVPPDVVERVAQLRRTGVPIAVVSNADGTVESLLRRGGLDFDVVIDSHVVGVAKPRPEIFDIALEKLGVAAGDTVHVGDTVWADVVGARAAGVRPLHLDPFADCHYPDGDHEHVRSLDDLVKMCQR